MANTIWKPHPKQAKALTSVCFETLFGGSRGGGKTDSGIAWLMYDIDNPRYRALVIRKNAEDTKDWLDRARRMYAGTGATITGQPGIIEFPSGAKIYVGHLKDDSAYTKYQGHEYQRILIEELTQIPSEELYMKLISSCRSTVDGLKPRVFATCNPGGIGHSWVKRRFVDIVKPMDIYTDSVSKRDRVYFPATVDDNPTLLEKDPAYVTFLESLPPDLKAQWRYGSWESVQFKGQIYGDCLTQLKEDGRIYSFPIESYMPVSVAFDIGLNDAMSLVFFQIQGEQIKVVDYHESNGHTWQWYAQYVKDTGYKIDEIILPHDGRKRSQESLRTFEDVLKENGFTVRVLTVTSDIRADIEKVKTMFNRIIFKAETTAQLLEALEMYRYGWDELRQIASSNPKHDWTSHACDAARYMCMSIEPKTNELELAQAYYALSNTDFEPNLLHESISHVSF